MRIDFSEEDRVSQKILEEMEQAAIQCVTREGIDPEQCEVSVSFVEDVEIQQLNREYREIDKVTDVLSFPLYENPEEIRTAQKMFPDQPVELGDVVICTQVAQQQAAEFGHSTEREFLYLFVHSVCHLLGYDHMEPEDKKVMRAREEEVLEALGVVRE